ncbi:hypothetical protein [Laspinema palackyanum]|uniref:hypothetical protein n=1 Tax=Laspinema palackyanum TaxID=3231601 RepID=UPI00345DFBEE|nr:hypothetical protein [Laspinema sp. D2c]
MERHPELSHIRRGFKPPSDVAARLMGLIPRRMLPRIHPVGPPAICRDRKATPNFLGFPVLMF